MKERQRRSRMNESLEQLKSLIPQAQNKKLDKSRVMSLAVDYIQSLEKQVEELQSLRPLEKPGINYVDGKKSQDLISRSIEASSKRTHNQSSETKDPIGDPTVSEWPPPTGEMNKKKKFD